MKILRRDLLGMGAAASFSAAGGLLYPAAAPAEEDVSEFFSMPEEAGDGVPALQAAPERIVEDGLIKAGLFKAPPLEMNLLDSKSLGGKATSVLGLPKMLEWVGVGMAHQEWYFGFIIVGAQSAHFSALYGYNRVSGDYFSHDSLGSAKKVRVADSMWDDTSYLHGRGYNMEVRHLLDQGIHEVEIDIKRSAGDPAVSAELTWHEDLEKIQPLVRTSPQGGRYFIFNHKAQMPIQGAMTVGGQEIVFDPGRDLANMDEVRSFGGSGFKINYNWFNFGGFDQKGRVIGLNVFQDEQRKNELWTENCIWTGDRLSFVGQVRFEMDPGDVMAPWRAVEEDGRVDVTFYPEGGKSVNLGPLARYFQKCGTFQGTLIDGAGEQHLIDDYYGCAEYADIF